MNELSTEKTMTVKEVSDVLSVSRQLISEKVKELFPGKEIVNGKTVYLNESEVTAIKLSIERNPHIPSTIVEGMPKTELEIDLLIEQAHKLLRQRIERLQGELDTARPKVEFYDTVTDSTDAIDMATTAKVLNLDFGRNKLFEILREKKILMDNNQPYQKYIDAGYFRVIEQKYMTNGDVHISFKTVVYQAGLDFIRELLKSV